MLWGMEDPARMKGNWTHVPGKAGVTFNTDEHVRLSLAAAGAVSAPGHGTLGKASWHGLQHGETRPSCQEIRVRACHCVPARTFNIFPLCGQRA